MKTLMLLLSFLMLALGTSAQENIDELRRKAETGDAEMPQMSSPYYFLMDGDTPISYGSSMFKGMEKGTPICTDMILVEDQPEISPVSTLYNDVARQIYDDYYGVSGSLPTVVKEGETYKSEYTLTLPENVQNVKNLKIVTLH